MRSISSRNTPNPRLIGTLLISAIAVTAAAMLWIALTGNKTAANSSASTTSSSPSTLQQNQQLRNLEQSLISPTTTRSISNQEPCQPCELCVLCEKCERIDTIAESLLGNLSLLSQLASITSERLSSSSSSSSASKSEPIVVNTKCPPPPLCSSSSESSTSKELIEHSVTSWAKTLTKASEETDTRRISFELITAPFPDPPVSFFFAVEETLHSATYIRDNEAENVRWWKSRLQEQKRKSGGTCLVLDVGSNGGYYSLLSRSMGCRVLSIDAQPRCLERLASSAAVNGFTTGIETAWTATSRNEQGSIQVGATKCSGLWAVKASAWIDAESAYNVEVRTRKLIDVLSEKKMLPEDNSDQPITLMKVDVEGSEVNVFTTALPLLEKKQILGILAEVVPWRVNTITPIDTVIDTFTRMYAAGYVCAIGSAASTFSLSYVLDAFKAKSSTVGEHWFCYLNE